MCKPPRGSTLYHQKERREAVREGGGKKTFPLAYLMPSYLLTILLLLSGRTLIWPRAPGTRHRQDPFQHFTRRTGNTGNPHRLSHLLSLNWAHCPQTIQFQGLSLYPVKCSRTNLHRVHLRPGDIQRWPVESLQTSSHTEATYSLPALPSAIFLSRRIITVSCANCETLTCHTQHVSFTGFYRRAAVLLLPYSSVAPCVFSWRRTLAGHTGYPHVASELFFARPVLGVSHDFRGDFRELHRKIVTVPLGSQWANTTYPLTFPSGCSISITAVLDHANPASPLYA